MGTIAKKILTKLGVSLALTGVYAWADYQLNGENSMVGISRNGYRMRKGIYEKEKQKETVILHPDDYSVE